MARVKYSPIVTDIAGSVGAVTFQRNKFGNTMRAKPLPVNPSSSAQYIIRQHVITIQAAWQSLTDAQRLQWDRFPDFSGQTIKRDRSVKISGHSLYLKYQLYRLMAGYSLLTTISYAFLPTLPVITTMVLDAGFFYINFNIPVNQASYFFILFMSNPRRGSAAFSERGLRYMYTTHLFSDAQDILDSYLTAFGVEPATPFYAHYKIIWFSVLAPIISGKITGVFTVTA